MPRKMIVYKKLGNSSVVLEIQLKREKKKKRGEKGRKEKREKRGGRKEGEKEGNLFIVLYEIY
jgi:hypothetical protein